LEQENAQQEPVEEVEGAQVSEPVEEVSEPAESVSEPTFSQADVARQIKGALEEAETKWQSRKDTEFQPLKDQNTELLKQIKDAQLATQEQREIDSWGDTAEVKAFHLTRREHAAQVEVDRQKRMETETLANQINLTNRMVKAKEIATAHPGMDVEDLMRCQSPEDMQGLVDIFDKIKTSLGGKQPQKVDSSVPSAPGVNLKDMEPLDAIRFAVEHPK